MKDTRPARECPGCNIVCRINECGRCDDCCQCDAPAPDVERPAGTASVTIVASGTQRAEFFNDFTVEGPSPSDAQIAEWEAEDESK
jgi:hypothetical protein